jgi:hypothetical protein
MGLAPSSLVSTWRSLLWKDWQQIKSMFMAVLIGLVAVQLLLWSIGSLTRDQALSGGLLQATQVLAFLSPALVVVGCCGLLVGQERQTGTWHWATSLPVRWTTALASKLLVTLAAAILIFYALIIIPVIEKLLGQMEQVQTAWINSFFSGYSLLFLIEVFVILTLASLLLREPLTAIASAGIAMILGQFIFFAVLAETVLESIAVSSEGEIIVSRVTIFIMLLLGAIPMLFAFRWRWGTGQFATMHFRPDLGTREPPIVRLRNDFITAPGQWDMLIQHSMSNSLWLKFTLAIASLLLTYSVGPLFAIPFSAILGLTTFESDQTLGRFRFLADRGVSPIKLACSRLVVSFFWWIAVCVVPLVVRLFVDNSPSAIVAAMGASLFVFSLAALASLCFHRVVFSIAIVAVVSLIGIGVCIGTPPETLKIAFDVLRIQRTPLLWFINLFWLLPTICILTAGILHVSKRWIIHGNERMIPQFVWICSLAAILPILISIHFAFLVLPATREWPLPAPLQEPTVRAVDLLSLNHLLLTRGLPEFERLPHQQLDHFLPQYISDFKNSLDVAGPAESTVEQPDPAVLQADLQQQRYQSIMQELAAGLENLLDAPVAEIGDALQFTSRLNSILFRSAIAAHLCMASGDTATATKLWRVNRRLQEIGHAVDPVATSDMRIISMKLLTRTHATQIAPMNMSEFLRELIPTEADERTPQEQEILLNSQDFNTWLKTGKSNQYPTQLENSWLAWFRIYPPTRWFLERWAASQLFEEYDRIRQLPKDNLSGRARAELLAKLEDN